MHLLLHKKIVITNSVVIVQQSPIDLNARSQAGSCCERSDCTRMQESMAENDEASVCDETASVSESYWMRHFDFECTCADG